MKEILIIIIICIFIENKQEDFSLLHDIALNHDYVILNVIFNFGLIGLYLGLLFIAVSMNTNFNLTSH